MSAIRDLLRLPVFPRATVPSIAERPSWAAVALLPLALALVGLAGLHLEIRLSPDFRDELIALDGDLAALTSLSTAVMTVVYCYWLFGTATGALHWASKALGGRGSWIVLATILAYVLGVDSLFSVVMLRLLLITAGSGWSDLVTSIFGLAASGWSLALAVMAVSYVYQLRLAKAGIAVFSAMLAVALLVVIGLLALRLLALLLRG